MSATEMNEWHEKRIHHISIFYRGHQVRILGDLPQCVDRRYALFHRIWCTNLLLRTISRCHVCRTSPDYKIPELDDVRIVIRILVDGFVV